MRKPWMLTGKDSNKNLPSSSGEIWETDCAQLDAMLDARYAEDARELVNHQAHQANWPEVKRINK